MQHRLPKDRFRDNAGPALAPRKQRWVNVAALLLLLPAWAATPDEESPTILRFERSIYFADPDGGQVLAQP